MGVVTRWKKRRRRAKAPSHRKRRTLRFDHGGCRSCGDGNPCDEGARITEYAYTADGQLARLTLINDVTGNQVTRFVYGTTLTDSEVARADLLRAKIYPMSDDGTAPSATDATESTSALNTPTTARARSSR